MTVSPVASVNPVDRTQEVQSQAQASRRATEAKESKASTQQKDDTVQLSPQAAAAMHGPDADGDGR